MHACDFLRRRHVTKVGMTATAGIILTSAMTPSKCIKRFSATNIVKLSSKAVIYFILQPRDVYRFFSGGGGTFKLKKIL